MEGKYGPEFAHYLVEAAATVILLELYGCRYFNLILVAVTETNTRNAVCV